MAENQVMQVLQGMYGSSKERKNNFLPVVKWDQLENHTNSNL